MSLERITVIGCGLIGGSFALGLKKQGFSGEIVGCDRAEVLERAKARGAIDRGVEDLKEAVAGADLIYLATPVITILNFLPPIAEAAKPGALVTDTGSTKVRICRLAKQILPGTITFLGGHPMAGKAAGGIENADPDLFIGAKYVVVEEAERLTAETPLDFARDRQRTQRNTQRESGEAGEKKTSAFAKATADESASALRASVDREKPEEAKGAKEKIVGEFLGWVRKLGAEPVFLDAETHDWAAAVVSHVPQLVSTALAATAADETDDDGLPLSLAAGGFRDMVRVAGSPYDIWRDIFLTNRENVVRTLLRFEKRLAGMREQLQSKELAEEFEKAQELIAQLKEERKNDG